MKNSALEPFHSGSLSADTLAGKVVGYLTVFPSRELTLEDICDKFELARSCQNIHVQLSKVVASGYISYDAGLDAYRKGERAIPSVLGAWGTA